tara:strand:- start:1331 stop:1996 length:666 start_codon:yes stop_codon:yes gene_type:complete
MHLSGIRKAAVLTWVVLTVGMAGCLEEEVQQTATDDDDPVVVNSAPTISGNPASAVLVGNRYSFTPTASDPDGDTLSFSVQNLPAWASFDASNGSVSGTPLLGDIGSFSNIRISVSDGNATATLSAFSIAVSQSADASMSISWTAPTENTDGSPLMNLAGYRIYYGLEEGNYPNMVEVNTAGTTTILVENLVPGTYYVVATSINSDGVESEQSGYAIKDAS